MVFFFFFWCCSFGCSLFLFGIFLFGLVFLVGRCGGGNDDADDFFVGIFFPGEKGRN